MAHVCARSSLCLRSTTFRSSPVPQQNLRYRSRQALARAAHSAQSDLFFVTHNCFRVKKEGCEEFEEIWKNRESHLKDTPGFVRFALLRGDEEGEYISESTWASRKAFQDWTSSNNFAKTHGKAEGEQQAKPQQSSKRAGMGALLEGPPKAKLYTAVTATEK